MANGTVTGEFVVVSHVRSGLKRELQFALRSQSEICGGGCLGRTRARKNLNGGSGGTEKRALNRGSGLKTARKERRVGKDGEANDDFDESDGAGGVVEEDEAKSDVVDVDESKGEFGESVSKRLFSDEATMAIVDDSALVQSEEHTCEDEEQEGKRGKGEDNVPANGKCEEENGKDLEEMENEHGNLVIDGDRPEDTFEGKQDEKGLHLQQEKIEKEGENESLSMNDNGDIIVGETGVLGNMGSIVLPKPNSSSCKIRRVKKLQNGSVRKPLRRFTRSMLKPECEVMTSEINADQEQRNLEQAVDCDGDKGLDASSSLVYRRKKEDSHEEISAEPCVGDLNGSSQVYLLTHNGDKKAQNGSVEKPSRRFTRSLLKQEGDSDNLNATNNIKVEEDTSDIEMDVQSPVTATTLKRGRPKKFLRNFPQRLKDLLDSGILEGLTVYYLRGTKIREAGTTGLKGMIKGSGILCFCGACKGAQVVTPTMYELHASSSNKRPPEYILLETGSTLRDVMNACKEAALTTLEETLCVIVGPSLKKSSLCFNCQGPMTKPCDTKTLLLCKSCVDIKEQQKVSHTSSLISSSAFERSPERSAGPETILSESKSSSVKSNSQGRVTRKDLRLHKLVFEEDILPDGTEVCYFVGGKKMLVGYKKGFGIHCSCCNEVVSPSQFEAHAGFATRRKPFQHIYTSNGVSLHELSVALSRDRRFSIRKNDDLCSICRDGGDLLCCDTCPRSFHPVCASLPGLPNGSWSCKYCENMFLREKFVVSNANAIAAGRVAGIDAIAQITKRCIRIVNSLASGLPSVCVLCRGHSYSRLGFGPRTVIICDQCEKEFHVGCLKEHNMADLEELPEGQWFCGADCKKIHTSLQNLIIHGEEKLGNNILNFIRKKQKPHEENGSDDNTNLDMRWRVLSGKLASSDDTKALLAKAISIFHERFDPISECGTRGDLIPAMVYGRQLKGQDFGGMYCTMLTVNQVIVSVGIFRIFGSELAELPLVATSNDCQGQGYFQCLFACIQRLLGFLNVKHLVLPAADEAKSIWTDKFGFTKMTQDEVNEYRKDFQMMVFEGTSMLRKPVPAPGAITKPDNTMDQ